MRNTPEADFQAHVQLVALAELTPNPRNARQHPEEQVAMLCGLIREYGFTNPILADLADGGMIVAGHGRRLALLRLIEAGETVRLPNGRQLPAGMVPAIDCSAWTQAQRRAYTLADNASALASTWDDDLLRIELGELRDESADLALTGFDPETLDKMLAAAPGPEAEEPADDARPTLAERFGVPPFSVLSAREGWWQDRKRAWIGLGIQSELGRGENLSSMEGAIGRRERIKMANTPRVGNGMADGLVALRAQQKAARANATPGGSKMPAADYSKSGARGDGRGRAVDG